MRPIEPINFEDECDKLLVEVDRLSELSERLSDRVRDLESEIEKVYLPAGAELRRLWSGEYELRIAAETRVRVLEAYVKTYEHIAGPLPPEIEAQLKEER